ncbi:NmrA/HSCARG family protein [Streptomyces aurantiacus]|uniref:Putative NmrA-like family domain-containing protein 1 n=1 Tax=Streptomyces aurantiacus JA 4570 TaxID=1286094 RepID=S3ZPN8_9ACTN|nr:NmrA/HSCARG family protein [Streptomyces aurantiacus]EPH45143.1 putative NmrA-like family domain-containing protein 1 [Streptomyces aurantiacus JA 4570]
MNSNKTVLVAGATGHQGGGAAQALLADGWNVRALIRDPDAAPARALAKAGATLVRGDLDDAESLARAAAGAHGVFSVQPLAVTEEELATEVRRGIAMADAARAAGVTHLVYSSVDGAERSTGIDHFESKARIEEHITATFPMATILRPVFFMDNLLWYADAADERVLELPVIPGRPMQMIAASDIGRIAAAVFAKPEAYLGARLAIAGDAISFEQVATTYQQVTGVPTRLMAQPIQDRMFEWFAKDGYRADIPALRADFPWLQRFDAFLGEALAPAHART